MDFIGFGELIPIAAILAAVAFAAMVVRIYPNRTENGGSA